MKNAARKELVAMVNASAEAARIEKAMQQWNDRRAVALVEKHDGKARQAVQVEGGDKPVEVKFSWAQEDESPSE